MCVLPEYMCVHHMYAWRPQKPKFGFPGTGAIDCWEMPCLC